VRQLTDESVAAGMRVELREDFGEAPPGQDGQAGRTAYRIVQEALTNVRKHAPGTPVRVSLAGTPATGLTVEVINTSPTRTPATADDPPAGLPPALEPATVSRAGQGLVGLAERVTLAGGRIEHGPTPAGGWRVSAWLPWAPATPADDAAPTHAAAASVPTRDAPAPGRPVTGSPGDRDRAQG
jgi:signal transduction histidine kinase